MVQKEEEPAHIKEEPTRCIKDDKPETLERRSLPNAKPLWEFKQMDWIPINFSKIVDKHRPYPNQKVLTSAIETDFSPERHTWYVLDKEIAREIIQKLFSEEEIDP